MVLDMNGAEKLVGHGDMLFAPANASKPARLQAAWVTESEIQEISEWVRGQREVVYQTDVEGLGRPVTAEEESAGSPGDDEDLVAQAAELVVRSQLGSTSMLQRKLKVGLRARRPPDGPARGAGHRGTVARLQGPRRARYSRGVGRVALHADRSVTTPDA